MLVSQIGVQLTLALSEEGWLKPWSIRPAIGNSTLREPREPWNAPFSNASLCSEASGPFYLNKFGSICSTFTDRILQPRIGWQLKPQELCALAIRVRDG
jgi:hypothetical protein